MRNLLLKTALASFALQGPVLAQDKDLSPDTFTGFYVGTHVGYGTAKVSQKTRRKYRDWRTGNMAPTGEMVWQTAWERNWQDDRQAKSAMEGGIFGLHLGYQHLFANRFLAGLEVHGAINGGMTDSYDIAPSLDKKIRYLSNYGADIKLGIRFRDVLTYTKFGIDSGQFERTVINARVAMPPVIPEKRHSQKKSHIGFSFGLGVDIPVTDHFHIGGEFKHIRYNQKLYMLPSTPSPDDMDGIVNVNDKSKASVNKFILTAKYKI